MAVRLRKTWLDIVNVLKMLWKLDRVLFLVCIGIALIDSVVPYIEIYLSAYVLDGLVEGIPFQVFLRAVCGVLLTILVLKILQAYLDKVYEVRVNTCGLDYNMLLARRTLEMDYQLLDSPMVNEINARIRNDSNWGAGFYSVLWQFPALLKSVMNLIFAVVVLIPLFTESDLFADGYALPVLIVFGVVCVCCTAFSAKKRKEMHALMDEDITGYTYRSYYLWNRHEYRQGMDIRIFGGQNLIEEHIIEEEKRLDEPWAKAFVTNRCQSGLANGFSAGILEAAAYLLVVIRTIAGALSVGELVKYATVIYRFSSAVSGGALMFSEFALSARRQQSSLDYINVEDVLPKGSLPV